MKVMAVSSGGGHWVELLRLTTVFGKFDTHYVTVQSEYRQDVPDSKFYRVTDATQWNKLRLLLLAAQILFLVLTIRPRAIVTTGAAPGYFALRFGKMIGARTVWIDTLAYVDSVSKAGQMVKNYADVWLTQWPEVATRDGPEYAGQVI